MAPQMLSNYEEIASSAENLQDAPSSNIELPLASINEKTVKIVTSTKDPPPYSTMLGRSRRCKPWIDTVNTLTISAVDIFEHLCNRKYTTRKLRLRTRDLLHALHKLRDRWNAESPYNTIDSYDPNNPHLPRLNQFDPYKNISRPRAGESLYHKKFMASIIEVFDDLYERANTPVRAREFHNTLFDLRDNWDSRDHKKHSSLYAAAPKATNEGFVTKTGKLFSVLKGGLA
ncbi:hypothetical protein WAI453_002339 [Rhynchosporium graminicola]|uniref:Uncharacterized protein n=1 Tax=Rhynchosporium graminicola TaxID=2792576 RepID=A0A1E1LBR9_9HELO|nr:uncharacterized protein RCO7_09630 [Rhynchosporium commune]